MKLSVLIGFLFINLNVVSQNLSFVDIKYLYEHSIDNCDSYLASKKYYFMKSEEAKDGEVCASTTWAYKRNNINNKATSFIVKTCDEANIGLIFYQFSNNTELEKIKTACKNQGFKFVKKSTSPYGTIWFTYESSKYRIEFGSGLDDDNNINVYMVSFNKLLN